MKYCGGGNIWKQRVISHQYVFCLSSVTIMYSNNNLILLYLKLTFRYWLQVIIDQEKN